MSAHSEEFIELCASYVLGHLEAGDRSRLEAHLASGCPDCEAALQEFGYASMLLAASVPAVSPAPEVKDRVLDAIRALPATEVAPAAAAPAAREERPSKRPEPQRKRVDRTPRERGRGMSWVGWLGWAAAAVLAVTVGTLYESSGRLREIIRTRQGEIGDLGKQLDDEREWTGILSAPGARVTEMVLTPEGQALRGRAIYDPTSRRAVIVLENALPPADQDYELWSIRGEALTSLGIVQADPRGTAVIRLDNAGDPASLDAFAVSMEPKGGSPSKTAPSGPVVMMGALKG